MHSSDILMFVGKWRWDVIQIFLSEYGLVLLPVLIDDAGHIIREKVQSAFGLLFETCSGGASVVSLLVFSNSLMYLAFP